MKADEIIQRREKLKEYLVSRAGLNLDIRSLAIQLGVNERTLWRDLRALENESQKVPLKKLTFRAEIISRTMEKVLLGVIGGTTNDTAKVAAVRVWHELFYKRLLFLKEYNLIDTNETDEGTKFTIELATPKEIIDLIDKALANQISPEEKEKLGAHKEDLFIRDRFNNFLSDPEIIKKTKEKSDAIWGKKESEKETIHPRGLSDVENTVNEDESNLTEEDQEVLVVSEPEEETILY